MILEKVKETSRKTLLVIMAVTLAVNLLSESAVTAYAAGNPLDTIRQYICLIGHDWNQVAELFTSSQKESYIEFFSNEDCINGNVGILNVNNAELIETVEVAYDDVSDYLSWDYAECESKFYAVGVDYSVNEDSIFFSNGISYNVISLALEENEWRICEYVQIAAPEALLEKGYEFSYEYESTIEMMEARQKGILMNGDGEVFDTIGRMVTLKDNTTSNSQISTFSTHATNSKIGIPKRTTPVCIAYYDKYKSAVTGKTQYVYRNYVDSMGNAVSNRTTIPFRTYCIGAAAGECGASTFDGTARQAIIIAIKTFTWYALINPDDINHGVNIRVYGKGPDEKDTSKTDPYFYTGNQAFRPRAVAGNPTIAEDYRIVERIWIEDSNNKIFKAFHRSYPKREDKGYSEYRSKTDDNNPDDWDSLNQNGCRYLVDKKICSTVYQILRYYYDKSSCSAGAIKFFYK